MLFRHSRSHRIRRNLFNIAKNVCTGLCCASVISNITATAGRDDVMRFFQTCIPFATDVMGAAVEKYGFEPTQTGM